MKITKRIAKEVHNEKVKSYDEGYKAGKSQCLADEIKFLEEIFDSNSNISQWDYRDFKIKERLSKLKEGNKR